MRSWLHPFIFHTSEKWNIHPKEIMRSQLHDFIPSSLMYQRAEQKKSWDHDFIQHSSLRTEIYIPKKSWDHDFTLHLWIFDTSETRNSSSEEIMQSWFHHFILDISATLRTKSWTYKNYCELSLTISSKPANLNFLGLHCFVCV